MSIKTLSIIVLLAVSATLPAQTKLIAHKSHSGSTAHFAMITANSLFDPEDSNFGQGPEPFVKTAQLDSVIFISDSVVVMVTSAYCQFRHDKSAGMKWQPGRDTVLHHPLFSAHFSLSEIKRRMKRDYYFRNPVDSVRFIGYDRVYPNTPPAVPPSNQPKNQPSPQAQPQQRQNDVFPILPDGNVEQPPTGFPTGWIVVIIGCLAICTGLFSWLNHRVKGNEKLA